MNKLFVVVLSLLSLMVSGGTAHVTHRVEDTGPWGSLSIALTSNEALSEKTVKATNRDLIIQTDTDYRDGLESIAGVLWMLTHLEGQPINLDTVTLYTKELPHFKIDPVSKALSGYDGENPIRGDLSADTFGAYLTGNAQNTDRNLTSDTETPIFSQRYLALLATAKGFLYQGDRLFLKAAPDGPMVATFQWLSRDPLPIKGVQWFPQYVNGQFAMLGTGFFPKTPRLFIDPTTNQVTGHSGCHTFEGLAAGMDDAGIDGVSHIIEILDIGSSAHCTRDSFRLLVHDDRAVVQSPQELANAYIDALQQVNQVERDADMLRLSAHPDVGVSIQLVTAYDRLKNIMNVRWRLAQLGDWDLTLNPPNTQHPPFIFIDLAFARLSGNLGCNYIQGYISEHRTSYPVIRDLFAFQAECVEAVLEQELYRALKEATHVERFHNQLIFRAKRYGPATAVFQEWSLVE